MVERYPQTGRRTRAQPRMVLRERMRLLISQLAILVFVVVALSISWARGHPVLRSEEIGLALVAGSVCWHAWRLVRERQWRLRR